MPTINFFDISERHGGSSVTQERDYSRHYRRTFALHCTTASVGSDVADWHAVEALGWSVGDHYSMVDDFATLIHEDTASFVSKISVERDDGDGLTFTASVEWEPYDVKEENPLDEPAEVQFDFNAYERICEKGYDGSNVLNVPLVNSAGDPFDPPVTADDSRPVLSIVRNELTFNYAQAWAYRDALNSDTFYGETAGKWKMKAPRAVRQWHRNAVAGTGGWYYRVSYELEFNPDGWDRDVRDQGMRKLKSGSTSLREFITNSDGSPVTEPVPLNGSGQPLAADAAPFYKPFKIYKRLPFAVWDLE